MTTTPKFEPTRRHAALGLAVIVALCMSLAGGFVAATAKSASPGADLRAATAVQSVVHVS